MTATTASGPQGPHHQQQAFVDYEASQSFKKMFLMSSHENLPQLEASSELSFSTSSSSTTASHGCELSLRSLAVNSSNSKLSFCTNHIKSLSLDSDQAREEEGLAWMKQSPQRKGGRHVQWGDLQVRKFPIIPGDHPDASGGPPITIDWDHFKEMEMALDEYEKRRRTRRTGEELRINWMDRKRLLRSLGYSELDVCRARAAADKVRSQRERTNSQSQRMEKLDLIREQVLRKVGRTLHPKVVLETKY